MCNATEISMASHTGWDGMGWDGMYCAKYQEHPDADADYDYTMMMMMTMIKWGTFDKLNIMLF